MCYSLNLTLENIAIIMSSYHLQFYEKMRVSHSKSGGMELRLVGEAIEPHVVLELDTEEVDFGHTYVGDTNVRKLELKNAGSLCVWYHVQLQGRRNCATFSEWDLLNTAKI